MRRSMLFGIGAAVLFALLPTGALAQGFTWTVPGDFSTIQAAINAVSDGDTIHVGPGTFAGALVNKSVHIKGVGGAAIDSGPVHSSGLIQGFRLVAGSDGATISHLTFTPNIDLAIMNGAAVDDVTVTQCTFLNSVQAVSNWVGNRWGITHNVITDLRTRCGGGIGILVADYTGSVVNDNVVSHNKISGTLHVSEGDCGGYAGTGIVLYADYRWGRLGTAQLAWNRVVKNHISLTSDTPNIVPVNAFELTDTRDDPAADPYPVIYQNAIGFNDFRGTDMQVALTPLDLENQNSLSRNFGDNRGHGLHPSVFGPGGNP